MRERPILMSGPMVRATLDGRKTQTRRICKPAMDINTGNDPAASVHMDGAGHGWVAWWPNPVSAQETAKLYPGPEGFPCPYGRPGVVLIVREGWRIRAWDHDDGLVLIEYRADGAISEWLEAGDDAETWIENVTRRLPDGYEDDPALLPWRPSIHMPRWASRLTLEITGVRVERLQDISEADAIAEGCQSHYCSPEDTASCEPGPIRELAKRLEGGFLTAKFDFQNLWESINGKGSWAANPWVWVLAFSPARPAGEGVGR